MAKKKASKQLILVSYSYVFLQCVDIIRDAIAVEVVLGRLDDIGVPNLTKWCRKPISSSWKVPSEIRIMAVFG
jgi:hypothetical protein